MCFFPSNKDLLQIASPTCQSAGLPSHPHEAPGLPHHQSLPSCNSSVESGKETDKALSLSKPPFNPRCGRWPWRLSSTSPQQASLWPHTTIRFRVANFISLLTIQCFVSDSHTSLFPGVAPPLRAGLRVRQRPHPPAAPPLLGRGVPHKQEVLAGHLHPGLHHHLQHCVVFETKLANWKTRMLINIFFSPAGWLSRRVVGYSADQNCWNSGKTRGTIGIIGTVGIIRNLEQLELLEFLELLE